VGSNPNIAVAASFIGASFLGTSAWAFISLISLWADNWRMNRQIKDGRGPRPDELRNASTMAGQLVLINVINIITGATAGIGASLFVGTDKLRWPPTGLAIALITAALIVTEITGIFVIRYTSRPTRAWITDTSIFRAYLTQVSASGLVSDEDMQDILASRSEWSCRTVVRPLRTAQEMQELGLELISAREEWASPASIDPVEFGKMLQARVSRKQVWLWIRRKRIWRLGIPPGASAFTLAALTLVTLNWYGYAGPGTLVPLIFFTPIWGGFLYGAAFFVARRDLIMTNRYLALEAKQLSDCDRLIEQIKELQAFRKSEVISNREAGSSVIVRIGRWDLRLRSTRTS